MGRLREYLEQWLEEGRRDLELARRFYNDGLYHVASFYAHQAAEKALKSLYYVGHKPHPRTHDLERLFLDLPDEARREPIPFTIRELRILTDYYEKSRYPDAIRGLPSEKITADDAKEAIGIAEKIVLWALEIREKAKIEDPDENALKAACKAVLRLIGKGVRVLRAYAFGSRVRGDWLENSDLDLLIVSDDFKGMRYEDRAKFVLELLDEDLLGEYSFNLFLLTQDEFEESLRGANPALIDASQYWIDLLKACVDKGS